jgi:hypothetical protein
VNPRTMDSASANIARILARERLPVSMLIASLSVTSLVPAVHFGSFS